MAASSNNGGGKAAGSARTVRAPADPRSRSGARPTTAPRQKTAGRNGTPVGAVMVVGAGIAGIQSSLDLAESGYKVYLVEKGPSIGGTMTQLDKTFPTNDCSMCIVSPKLVEASRHNNVELLSYSEVEAVRGTPGAFTVTVRRKARSVDLAKCTGCGACQAACPVHNRIRLPEAFEPEPDDVVTAVDTIIDRHGAERSAMIMVLQDANRALRYLPEKALLRISQRLKVPYAEVYGAASFYKALSLEPRGLHLIQLCVGTACHVRGSKRIQEQIQDLLHIQPGQTTDDRLFTLETVNCLGACALGPVMVLDGAYHGHLTAGKVETIVAECKGTANG